MQGVTLGGGGGNIVGNLRYVIYGWPQEKTEKWLGIKIKLGTNREYKFKPEITFKVFENIFLIIRVNKENKECLLFKIELNIMNVFGSYNILKNV